MSTLNESLEFIDNWIQQNTSNSDLKPGLSYEKIQRIAEQLPFKLSLEVCQLYMWRNGGSLEILPIPDLTYGIDYEVIQRFCSLNESIEIAKDWNNGWFPLFNTDGIIFWIVGEQEQKRTTPIFSNDELELPNEPRFKSLTEMMAKIVEGVKASTC
jgi:hypothetical protein